MASRIALAHHDQDGAAVAGGTRAEPLPAVEHVVVAVPIDPQRHVRRVRRGHVGLGHGERRADRAGEERLEPAGLHLWRRVVVEDLHVARVGRGAVEHQRGERHLAELLGDRGVVEVGQPRPRGAGLQVGQEHVPQPPDTCLGAQLLEHRRVGVDAGVRRLLLVLGLVGVDLVVHEPADVVEQPASCAAGGRVAVRGDRHRYASTIRAVTMPNMPSGPSAWVRMWQCQAHTPGSVALYSTV